MCVYVRMAYCAALSVNVEWLFLGFVYETNREQIEKNYCREYTQFPPSATAVAHVRFRRVRRWV